MDQNSRPWKILIASVCACFCGVGVFGMVKHYNPLARYPYGTEEEREVLKTKLSPKEIDSLINSQLQPQTILPFLDNPDFDISNTLYYWTALKTRTASADSIVVFVNEFRDRLNYQSLENWLRWYTYQDLTSFFRTGSNAQLAENPADPMLILNQDQTVYSYRPEGMVEDDGMILRTEAMDAWKQLEQAAAQAGFIISARNGYVSFDEAKTNPAVPGFDYPDQQLGSSVMLDAGTQWDLICQSVADQDQNVNYEKAADLLTDYQQMMSLWLKDNAWKYGFILRYPEDKDEVTNHIWQPFFVRYVGTEAAKDMYENGWCLEEYVKQQHN